VTGDSRPRLGDRVEHAIEQRAREPDVVAEQEAAQPSGNLRRTIIWVAVTGVSLYLVAPSLVQVLGSWDDVTGLAPLWLLAMLALQTASQACFVALQRIALHAQSWYPIVTSQLAANAMAKIAPGGGAVGSALQYKMLVQAGFKRSDAVAALTSANLLVFGVVLALPVLAIPTIIRGGVDRSLVEATIVGLAVFAVLFVIAYFLLARDRPLRALARAIQAIRNKMRRKCEPLTTLPDRFVRERDRILAVLGPRWKAALAWTIGRWAFDYASLVAALAAVGAHPRPSLVLLAFCAAQLLTQIPITPGGLGFVEAGLTAMLTLAGVSAGAATLATFAYRLFSYWLPLPLGLVGVVLHRRRYGGANDTAPAPG
jgi:uncharacterized protein (TIRG00374 family)